MSELPLGHDESEDPTPNGRHRLDEVFAAGIKHSELGKMALREHNRGQERLDRTERAIQASKHIDDSEQFPSYHHDPDLDDEVLDMIDAISIRIP